MSQAIAHALVWHILHEGVTLEPTKQVGVDKQRLVLLELAVHADAGGVSWPGRKYLSEKLQMPERTISEALSVLEEAGHVSRTAPKKRGQLVRWRVLPGVLPTLLGLNESTEVVGPVVGQVVRQVVGLARHEEEVEVENPPQIFPNTSGQRDQAQGGRKEAGKPAAQLAAQLVERDLADRPPKQPAGLPLKRQKQRDLLPLCEQALALPGAAAHPKAAERVVLAWYRSEKPDRHDMAALEGRELPVFRAADLPPPPKRTLDQLPKEVQDMVAEGKKRKAVRAG